MWEILAVYLSMFKKDCFQRVVCKKKGHILVRIFRKPSVHLWVKEDKERKISCMTKRTSSFSLSCPTKSGSIGAGKPKNMGCTTTTRQIDKASEESQYSCGCNCRRKAQLLLLLSERTDTMHVSHVVDSDKEKKLHLVWTNTTALPSNRQPDKEWQGEEATSCLIVRNLVAIKWRPKHLLSDVRPLALVSHFTTVFLPGGDMAQHLEMEISREKCCLSLLRENYI